MKACDPRAVESRWRTAWAEAGCNRAPDRPTRKKFFNYDSGPFPNGPLHLGHARTYVLGDVSARYRRLKGDDVLYGTEWDAFGLPNELAAAKEGVTPRELTERWIGTMSRQLGELGVSYDFERIKNTSDPAYYRWTQALFLRLLGRGIVQRKTREVAWCPRCETALSRSQVEAERCWRCRRATEVRTMTQWFADVGATAPRLLETLDRLEGWSAAARKRTRGEMLDGDWLISRQRQWGTPVPVVHCDGCGVVPVPESELPVELEAPAEVACPQCSQPASRDPDTLDCFFDDIWCFWSCLLDLDGPVDFASGGVAAWMPVDLFHSGLDTVAYLPLHRFLGALLHDEGDLADPEPIVAHHGHEMVLRRGRKMSTHLGNAVSPTPLIRKHGADALRVAVLWAAAPSKPIHWSDEGLERASAWLERMYRLYATWAEAGAETDASAGSSKAAQALRRRTAEAASDVARFIEEYRPNAGVETLYSLFRELEGFATTRLATGRLRPGDAAVLQRALRDLAILLTPFAPHLAEELWERLGEPPFVVRARWPGA